MDLLKSSKRRGGGLVGLQNSLSGQDDVVCQVWTTVISRPRSLQNGIVSSYTIGECTPPSTDGIKMLSDSFFRLHGMLWEDMAEINTFYFAL